MDTGDIVASTIATVSLIATAILAYRQATRVERLGKVTPRLLGSLSTPLSTESAP